MNAVPILKPIFVRIGLFAGAAAMISGCVPALMVAGMSTTAVVATQERSAGNAFDDSTLQLDLNSALSKADKEMYRQVNIEVVEQRVMLTGIVQDQATKDLATKAVWETARVKDVINELQVSGQAQWPSYPNDAWITSQLRTRILTDARVRQINYSIETVAGTIYLFGIARTQAELDQVTEHARRIRGVKQVVNHVMLADDPKRNA